jgi:hypothetical protein
VIILLPRGPQREETRMFQPADPVGPDPGPATLRVDSDQVVRLRKRLESVRVRVDTFLTNEAESLSIRQLGADPVSAETANAFNENAKVASQVAWEYVRQLQQVIEALDKSMAAYQLADDTHADIYRQATS